MIRSVLLCVVVSLLACSSDKADEDPREGMNPGECSDGADNDGDGDYDCQDPDCRERSPLRPQRKWWRNR